jgi:hypothetical protein
MRCRVDSVLEPPSDAGRVTTPFIVANNQARNASQLVTAFLQSFRESEVFAQPMVRIETRGAQDARSEQRIAAGDRHQGRHNARAGPADARHNRDIAVRDSHAAYGVASRDRIKTSPQPIGRQVNVAIDESDEFGSCCVDTGTPGGSTPHIRKQPDNSDACIPGSFPLDGSSCVISRAVVNEGDLEVNVGVLAQDRSNGDRAVGALVVSNDNERNFRDARTHRRDNRVANLVFAGGRT